MANIVSIGWSGIRSLYSKYERHISSSALVGGFLFDIFTLTRVDEFLENFWIIAHLLVAAIGIILLNLYEKKSTKHSSDNPTTIYLLLIISIQFAFGGLISTFLVFYFRSAALSTAWPFLLILGVAFVCNELLKHRYSRLSFQISYLFLSIFSFMTYFLPVVYHRLGQDIFVLSGLVSLVLIGLFIFLLSAITREKFYQSRYLVITGIAIIYVMFNILYFTNIIPPIPLSLKDADALHSVARDTNGDYIVQYEDESWFAHIRDYFRTYGIFHYVAGEQVYIYTSIFSPSSINLDIIHEWQYYDTTSHKWVTAGRIPLPLIGGRDQGFRTYSAKSLDTPGLWRVNIETKQGQLLGRVKFDAVQVYTEPILITDTRI